jgi:hypothetical protein
MWSPAWTLLYATTNFVQAAIPNCDASHGILSKFRMQHTSPLIQSFIAQFFASENALHFPFVQRRLQRIEFALENINFLLQIRHFPFRQEANTGSVIIVSLFAVQQHGFNLFGATLPTDQNFFALYCLFTTSPPRDKVSYGFPNIDIYSVLECKRHRAPTVESNSSREAACTQRTPQVSWFHLPKELPSIRNSNAIHCVKLAETRILINCRTVSKPRQTLSQIYVVDLCSRWMFGFLLRLFRPKTRLSHKTCPLDDHVSLRGPHFFEDFPWCMASYPP